METSKTGNTSRHRSKSGKTVTSGRKTMDLEGGGGGGGAEGDELAGGGGDDDDGAADDENDQVWSLTQFYSVDFSKSRIGVKKCVFNKRTIKGCISCC